MATRYPAKELRITNAKAFIEALSRSDGRSTKNSNILYAVIGKNTEYANEPTPSNAVESVQAKHYGLWKDAIGAKKITPADVSNVIPRYNWTSGTVYAMYRDIDADLYSRQFYVVTDEFNVYKCLYNNNGGASTIKPSGFSVTPFTTSDGYTWKYMYSINLNDQEKFVTSSFIPVQTFETSDGSAESARQVAVQNASVNGSIEIIEVNNAGQNYTSLDNGFVEAGSTRTLSLSLAGQSPSTVDNFYNGSSVYIISGTGAGQLRRITNYSGSTRTLTVNSAFTTIANTDSRVVISPTVAIRGDGIGALAYSRVNTNTGAISNVTVIDTGRFYTSAEAFITSNTLYGTGATANVIISPVGGHGKDAVRELGGDKIILNVQIQGTEGVSVDGKGYIPSNTDFRTISILKDPVLKVNSNNVVQTQAIANTSNSPSTLRLGTRLLISYNEMENDEPQNEFEVGDVITNERMRLRAALGRLEFITDLSSVTRENQAMNNAIYGANGTIYFIKEDDSGLRDSSFYNVYLNNVESFSNYVPFTKDDELLKRGNETIVATVADIQGPEANTYSGEFIYTENIRKVTKDVEQVEDIKIILDF